MPAAPPVSTINSMRTNKHCFHDHTRQRIGAAAARLTAARPHATVQHPECSQCAEENLPQPQFGRECAAPPSPAHDVCAQPTDER